MILSADKEHYMKPRQLAALAVLALLVTGVAGILFANRSKVDTQGLQVVAAENFWGNIASQLGAPYAHVTSIITNPNADPHLYESDARDAADVSSARVVIINGMGYDDFMSKLLSSSGSNNRSVVSVQQVYGFATGSNPHLWYDIPRIPEAATAITAQYIAQDPAHKATYQRNLVTFDQSLQPLLKDVTTIRQLYGGTPVAYTEPVPGYLLSAAKLMVVTPEGFAKSIEDGTDPSPASTEAMDSLMTGKETHLLLYNTQTVSAVTQSVKDFAKQSDIPIVGVSETMPSNEPTYQAWQASQIKEIEQALSKTK